MFVLLWVTEFFFGGRLIDQISLSFFPSLLSIYSPFLIHSLSCLILSLYHRILHVQQNTGKINLFLLISRKWGIDILLYKNITCNRIIGTNKPITLIYQYLYCIILYFDHITPPSINSPPFPYLVTSNTLFLDLFSPRPPQVDISARTNPRSKKPLDSSHRIGRTHQETNLILFSCPSLTTTTGM